MGNGRLARFFQLASATGSVCEYKAAAMSQPAVVACHLRAAAGGRQLPINGWNDAPPFKQIERRSVNRERFRQNAWVLGTKFVPRKTIEYLGRVRRRAS
jgi:hypothetical protein